MLWLHFRLYLSKAESLFTEGMYRIFPNTVWVSAPFHFLSLLEGNKNLRTVEACYAIAFRLI
jgi:hypothetical protein